MPDCMVYSCCNERGGNLWAKATGGNLGVQCKGLQQPCHQRDLTSCLKDVFVIGDLGSKPYG